MKYELIATLGPASESVTVWDSMLAAGVTAFRLNTSHLSLSDLRVWLGRLQAFFSSSQAQIPLVLDLQGSKWRLGSFLPFTLEEGEKVTLIHAEETASSQTLPVPHPDFFQAAVHSSQEIILDDARVRLIIDEIQPDSITARVVHGENILPHKGITFSSSTYRIESLSSKDQSILQETHHLSHIRYALSYVRDAAEMSRYRELVGPNSYLIAKIERRSSVNEPLQVAEFADELWLCRGDLGAELGLPAMAEAVHRFSGQLKAVSKPVLLAGQVLEHMTAHSLPTRSEVCYCYDMLIQGYNGFVLSDETAIGRYPLESCRSAALYQS